MPTPTFKDSRLGPGTLTLGSTDFGVQISNVVLRPNQDSQDGTPTLGMPEPAPILTTTWELSGTAVQDWEDPAGFVEYARTNNNTVVTFTWVPNTANGVSFSGQCQVQAIDIGGDVSAQNTSDFTFPVVGQPERTEGAATVAPAPPVTYND